MRLLENVVIPKNTGKAFILRKGQRIRVIAVEEALAVADFVVFNIDNLKERFDQARTKVHQRKIFLSTGDRLLSKFCNTMLTITEDKYKEGTHDLQKGMCSGLSYSLIYKTGTCPELVAKKEDVPDHGCWENLSEALKPWNIAPEDIPSPFNIFQTMLIDGSTGQIEFTNIGPRPGTYIELRAEMNCLIAVSACPHANKGGRIKIEVYEE
ncbi:DUF1989 domain-containing protein [Chloroflexota bacterium]